MLADRAARDRPGRYANDIAQPASVIYRPLKQSDIISALESTFPRCYQIIFSYAIHLHTPSHDSSKKETPSPPQPAAPPLAPQMLQRASRVSRSAVPCACVGGARKSSLTSSQTRKSAVRNAPNPRRRGQYVQPAGPCSTVSPGRPASANGMGHGVWRQADVRGRRGSAPLHGGGDACGQPTR